jgi:Family of unknown function (DUF5695)
MYGGFGISLDVLLDAGNRGFLKHPAAPQPFIGLFVHARAREVLPGAGDILETARSKGAVGEVRLPPDLRIGSQTSVGLAPAVDQSIARTVLPMDLDGRLFLNYAPKVTALTVEPQGAITIHEDKPTRSGWKAYTLRGKNWGRARLLS